MIHIEMFNKMFHYNEDTLLDLIYEKNMFKIMD